MLTTGDGCRDTTTVVLWLQTQKLFADLRIPSPTPAASCACVEDCSPQQLQELAAQQGFAGVTEVVSDICTWNRELDFQPKRGPPDVGKMHFVTDNFLTEDDPSGHNAYHEDWQRVERSSSDVWGYRLQAADQPSRKGFLLGSGNFFFFAADRRVELLPEGDLLSQLQQASEPEQHQKLEMELSFGTIADSKSPSWTILHSTLPGRVSRTLLQDTVTPQSLYEHAQSSSASLDMGAVRPVGGWKLAQA